METLRSDQEFRWGVEAYHNGSYGNAVLSFENSIAVKPDNWLAREWLGTALHKMGLEDQALQEWRFLQDRNQAGAVLNNRIETVSARRSLASELKDKTRYVVASEFTTTQDDDFPIRRPTAVRPRRDGTFFVVPFGSQDILLVDANFRVDRVLRGGVLGFDRPFDLIEAEDGFLYVSEYGSDQISRCTLQGRRLFSFGGRGIGPGQMLGPQFMALDGRGYLYVTDIGNRRVDKFDLDGNFVLSFGRARDGFVGFTAPSGIAIRDDHVYVADRNHGSIYVFDLSGNYQATLLKGRLQHPEGLLSVDERTILVADGRHVLSLDIEFDTASSVGDTAPYASRILGVGIDANGNILAADFEQEKILQLAPVDSLYAGLVTRIERITAHDFPEVVADITVTDRSGRPIIGLRAENFRLSEAGRLVTDPQLVWRGSEPNPTSVVVVAERSPAVSDDILDETLDHIYRALAGRSEISLVTAAREASVEAQPGATRLTFLARAQDVRPDASWKIDDALRVAATQLIPTRGHKAIIFVGAGHVSLDAYASSSVVELAQYLTNNSIPFYAVTTSADGPTGDIAFLSESTGGTTAAVHAPEGIAPLIARLANHNSPRYILRFQSTSESDFGRRYIPLEADATVQRRSGRDESGYFAPRQF